MMQKNGGGGGEDQMVVDLGNIDPQRLFLEGEYDDHQVRHKPPFYISSLSPSQMESLAAVCDAFLPSVDVPANTAVDDSVATFYRSSASMAGTPERVGGLMSERLKHPKKWLIMLVLWLLSTRLGTLMLCGPNSITGHFPYFQSFPQLPQKKREEILIFWKFNFIYLLRMLFKAMKLLCVLVYFSQVNDKNENLTWKAIGYPGPDPQFKPLINSQNKSSQHSPNGRSNHRHNEQIKEEANKEELFGPLYRGLVNMSLPRDIVADTLRLSGFPVSVRHGKGNVPGSTSPSLVIQCDAVVIGSGSGGGVLAGVLAKAGYKVLLLEKGNYFARNNLPLLEGFAMDQMYLSSGLLATDDMGAVILAGSTVGGGSTVNWSTSIKTPQHVMNEWSDHYSLELYGSKLYKEALDVVCAKMGVQSEINDEGFNNAILRKGCQELGYPINTIPRNAESDHYCGWCSLGCKDGRKKGTAETWLVDLVNSGNGAILPGCEAIKILCKQKSGKHKEMASGVAFEFEYKGIKDLCVVESKVTIAACGAISTPALLKASGLKNPNIGKNLRLHPVTMAWGYFPEGQWPEEWKKSYEGGIMTAMSTVVVDFDRSGYGAVIQTPSLHPGMFSALMPWVSGSDMKRRMSRISRTAHIFALARDKGSGTVSSPTSISYQMNTDDEKNLQRGLERILRILAAAGAEEIGTHHPKGKSLNVKKVSYHEFERFVKKESSRPLRDLSSQICSAHQMGSCRMGFDPKDSVVNQMGETWEVEGLFLADTSVFPTALGVNPMVTVQAIAYCTAQFVLEVLRRKK
ncbi:hypothetical protein K2173_009500 [Erythroxylum novogranatense]|uniref:long-chain-alcohol oxidase n=1 Tax=Erythroxylum novogranatense TaxID=1862640 RepID=A0AAV8U7B8_9ROSI|nr:hypothetical protein K2173_009500 [Erythroxylum novogranatense]